MTVGGVRGASRVRERAGADGACEGRARLHPHRVARRRERYRNIGILAAIAIPVFLARRTSAYEAAAQSDVRNGAAAATACASTAQGSFATCDEVTLTGTFDCNQTTGVESEVITTEAGRWVARSQHGQGGRAFQFDSNEGRVTPLAVRFSPGAP